MPTTLAVTADGGIDLRNGRGPQLVTGAEAAQSFLRARFATRAGEWGYNLEYGIPYNDAILGRYFDDIAAAAIYADQASRPRGIAPVPIGAVTFSVDLSARELSARISPIRLTNGDTLDFEVT